MSSSWCRTCLARHTAVNRYCQALIKEALCAHADALGEWTELNVIVSARWRCHSRRDLTGCACVTVEASAIVIRRLSRRGVADASVQAWAIQTSRRELAKISGKGSGACAIRNRLHYGAGSAILANVDRTCVGHWRRTVGSTVGTVVVCLALAWIGESGHQGTYATVQTRIRITRVF